MNMNATRYIEPAALHDEMLRLRQEDRWTFWNASPVWTGANLILPKMLPILRADLA